MIWDQLTSPEFDALSKHIPVILPMAATEQHGPHLPLATDRMIGWHFLKTLHQELPAKVLILPPVSIGCSTHHMDFAGTLSISHDTFAAQVEDIVESVIAHDFQNIILFNSHGGNKGITQVLLERLGPEVSHLVAVTWWQLATEALKDISDTPPGGVGHAGEFETSLMLHIAPDLVRSELIEPGKNQKTFTWAEADMLRSGSASLYRSMYEMTSNGTFGDPTAASAEKGIKITRLVVARMREIVLDLQR